MVAKEFVKWRILRIFRRRSGKFKPKSPGHRYSSWNWPKMPDIWRSVNWAILSIILTLCAMYSVLCTACYAHCAWMNYLCFPTGPIIGGWIRKRDFHIWSWLFHPKAPPKDRWRSACLYRRRGGNIFFLGCHFFHVLWHDSKLNALIGKLSGN